MSAHLTDLTGQRFGRWLVIAKSHVDSRGYWHWHCKCDCTTERVVSGRSLRSGVSQSCGCTGRNYQHGMTGTPTFKSWDSMRQRCDNPNDPSYAKYGGNGIAYCERWRSFENFLQDMGERPPETSLDRIDNTKGYGPENCRWATRSEQQRNKGNSRWITYNGETKMLIDWSKEMGIPYDLLLRRANRGLEADALFAPSRSRKTSRFDGLK